MHFYQYGHSKYSIVRRKYLLNRDVHGIDAGEIFITLSRRRQIFYEEILKIHEITQNFGVFLRYTVSLNKFD